MWLHHQLAVDKAARKLHLMNAPAHKEHQTRALRDESHVQTQEAITLKVERAAWWVSARSITNRYKEADEFTRTPGSREGSNHSKPPAAY
jgi:hypothetical protein